MSDNYHNKYLKYKLKYQQLKNNKIGGSSSSNINIHRFHVNSNDRIRSFEELPTLSDVYMPLIYYALDPASVTIPFLNDMDELLSSISHLANLDEYDGITLFDKLLTFIRGSLLRKNIFNIDLLRFNKPNHISGKDQESILEAEGMGALMNTLAGIIKTRYVGVKITYTNPINLSRGHTIYHSSARGSPRGSPRSPILDSTMRNFYEELINVINGREFSTIIDNWNTIMQCIMENIEFLPAEMMELTDDSIRTSPRILLDILKELLYGRTELADIEILEINQELLRRKSYMRHIINAMPFCNLK